MDSYKKFLNYFYHNVFLHDIQPRGEYSQEAEKQRNNCNMIRTFKSIVCGAIFSLNTDENFSYAYICHVSAVFILVITEVAHEILRYYSRAGKYPNPDPWRERLVKFRLGAKLICAAMFVLFGKYEHFFTAFLFENAFLCNTLD